MGPHLDAFYLEGKTDAFNKHLESPWTEAVDWCAYLAISFFVLGLAFTMMFVGANIREAKRMSNTEITEKVFTSDFGKAVKPAAMTPVPCGGEDRGAKPPAMTPVQPAPVPSEPRARGIVSTVLHG